MQKACPIGQRFTKLVVTGEAPKRRANRRRWYLLCDCGRIVDTQMNNVLSGNSTTCGKCSRALPGTAKRPPGHVNRDQCYRSYQRGAKARGLEFALTFMEWFYLTQKCCVYCGAVPGNSMCLKRADGTPRAGIAFVYNGIDRVDSSVGYTLQNSVTCCYDCNRSKMRRTHSAFIGWIARAHEHLVQTGVL